MLPEAIDVNIVRGLGSATVVLEDDYCLFLAVSYGVAVGDGLEGESLVLTIFFAVYHYAGDFRELRTANKVNGLSVGSGVHGSI